MTDDIIRRLREAIAAGPSPGEWRVSKYRDGRNALIYDADYFELARVCYPNRDANAAFIAACNPAAIRELLAERDALKGFADLWYFVMDEAPRDFERIVAEHQPKDWLQEAAKLRDAARGSE